jgi:sugar phosphate isomerase/epimerase
MGCEIIFDNLVRVKNHPVKEDTKMNRRQFMGTSLAATAGLVVNLNGTSHSDQKRRSNMKVGLYSITFLGIWYRGQALTLEQMIGRARKYGYGGIEIDGKRPHGNPLDWPTRRCKELKTISQGEGIEIYGVAANNDFSSPIPEYRECQIAYVKELIRMTSDLGARTLRMFLAWPGVTKHPQIAQYAIARNIWKHTHEKFSEDEIWSWCREGMAECARYAEEAGVILALQNHAPVIRDYRDVLRMVEEVDSPNLKVSLDAPIMADKSPENIRRAAKAVGDLQVLSYFGGEYERDKDGKVNGAPFYKPFVRAMHGIGYSGYFSYELCHSLPVVNGQTVGIEYAEKNAQLAAEFMRGLITEVSKE